MPKNWGTYAQWFAIGIALIGAIFAFDRRLTRMETQVQADVIRSVEMRKQEFKGYEILFAGIRDKVNSVDRKMELRFDRLERKMDRHIEISYGNPR